MSDPRTTETTYVPFTMEDLSRHPCLFLVEEIAIEEAKRRFPMRESDPRPPDEQ